VAETHREAVEGVRPRIERYIEVFAEAVRSWVGHHAGQYADYGKMVDSIARTTVDSMLEKNQVLIGTSEEVVAQLQTHVDVFGEIEPSLQVNFGGMEDGEAFRTLELLANQVMPRFPPP
jgi:alkanesulfonate monooxygenase SsuD/methylene tetrahydromethanopterin reductase-like flavin-dependent oxidoreductase (luciferase family)